MNGSSCNLYLRLRLLSFFLLILVLSAVLCTPAKAQQDAAGSHDPLAEILLRKGILTPDDMKQIDGAATPQQAEDLMARILFDKGVLSNAEYAADCRKAARSCDAGFSRYASRAGRERCAGSGRSQLSYCGTQTAVGQPPFTSSCGVRRGEAPIPGRSMRRSCPFASSP